MAAAPPPEKQKIVVRTQTAVTQNSFFVSTIVWKHNSLSQSSTRIPFVTYCYLIVYGLQPMSMTDCNIIQSPSEKIISHGAGVLVSLCNHNSSAKI